MPVVDLPHPRPGVLCVEADPVAPAREISSEVDLVARGNEGQAVRQNQVGALAKRPYANVRAGEVTCQRF